MEYQIGGGIANTNRGKVVCDRSVLLSIINLSAKEIEGVSNLKDNFSKLAKRWFSTKYHDGVKVIYENDGITIDIYLEINSNVTISDVAYKVQENVKNGISYMMDIKINSINVHILGVNYPLEVE